MTKPAQSSLDLMELPEELKAVGKRHPDALRRMAALPQAKLLNLRDCLGWLSHVEDFDRERLNWHLDRLGGIGGSETGAVLAWARGEIKSRKTVHSLCRDKLLKRFPDPPNADMSRGSMLEEHIRSVFEGRLSRDGFVWKRREDLENKVNGARPEAYPWLRASVDGMYEINGRIVLVDFKAPSPDSLMRQLRMEGDDEYKVQLNHYLIVADAADVQVDDCWLALYDYVRVATDGVQIIPVQKDPLLQQIIVQSTGELWNDWIMQGKIPEQISKITLEPTEALPEEIEQSAKRAAIAAQLKKAAETELDVSKQVVKDWFEKNGRVGDSPIYVGRAMEGSPGFMKLTAELELDTERAVEALERRGWDDAALEELRVPGPYKDVNSLGKHYDNLREASWGIFQKLISGENPSPEELAKLAKVLDKHPPRKAREFSPELVTQALVACGEKVHDYQREVVSLNPDRRSRGDMDEAAQVAHHSISRIVEEMVENGIRIEEGLEAETDFMSEVPASSF